MVGAPASLRFSTREVFGPERRRAVHTLLEQGLLPVEPLPERMPAVELVKWRLPCASVLWGSFGGVRQIGEPGPGEAGHDLFFGINTSGASLARHRGGELSLGAGDALFVGLDAGRFTWAAGPLTKGSNLCHGTGGNGYAFLKLYHRTNDPIWLDRARQFAMTAIVQYRGSQMAVGRGRYSLWTGDIGFAIYLWDCITAEPRFPTIDVF